MKKTLLVLALSLLSTTAVLAQETSSGSAPAAGNSVTAAASSPSQDGVVANLAAWVKAPKLDKDGKQVVDETGIPQWILTPVDDANIVPGDRIQYQVTLKNPKDEALKDFSFQSAVPAAVSVDPASFRSKADVKVLYEPIGQEGTFKPISEVVDGKTVYADPATIGLIRVDLSEIGAKSEIGIAYEIVLK